MTGWTRWAGQERTRPAGGAGAVPGCCFVLAAGIAAAVLVALAGAT